MRFTVTLLAGVAAFAAGTLVTPADHIPVCDAEARIETNVDTRADWRQEPALQAAPTGNATTSERGAAPLEGVQVLDSRATPPAHPGVTRAGRSGRTSPTGTGVSTFATRHAVAGNDALPPVGHGARVGRGKSRSVGGVAGAQTAAAEGSDADAGKEWYEFEAKVGDRCRVVAEPEDKSTPSLDLGMTLYDPDGNFCATGATRILGHHSRLLCLAKKAGTYRLSVAPLEETMAGTYRIHFDIGPNDAAAEREAQVLGGAAVQLRDNSDTQGTLDTYGGQLQFRGDDRGAADEYSVYLEKGARLFIECLSTAFDAYLFVLTPSGDVLRMRDGGFDEGDDARTDFTAESSGLHRVIVSTYHREGLGAYRLILRTVTP